MLQFKMKMSKRIEWYAVLTFYFIWIWIFMIVYGTVSTTASGITWTKYDFEGISTEAVCNQRDVQFIKHDVSDPITCGKICDEDKKCISVDVQKITNALGVKNFTKAVQYTYQHVFCIFRKTVSKFRE